MTGGPMVDWTKLKVPADLIGVKGSVLYLLLELSKQTQDMGTKLALALFMVVDCVAIAVEVYIAALARYHKTQA